MSAKVDLNRYFNIPAEITGKTMSPALQDEFVTGFKIFGMPKDIAPEDFKKKFDARAAVELPTLPLSLWRDKDNDTVYGMSDANNTGTYIQIVFKKPIDLESTAELLEDVLFDIFEQRGQRHDYLVKPDHQCCWIETMAELNRAYRNRMSNNSGWRLGGH